MIFERFEDPSLSHYSYAIGCPAAGQLAVVDPKRDVDTYLDFAAQKGLRITHVLETHIHADFASGARELSGRTGAELWLSAYDDGEIFEVSFDHRPVRDGDAFELGAVRVEALHTPGHTPEHLSFIVYDTARSRSAPFALLSGDFLFVGSLGRPDLLGEEVKLELARKLYDSVTHKLRDLPDGTEIYPAHGAGSMCGAGMSGLPSSTLGYERAANPYLDSSLGRDAFVERILGSVPPFPNYYRRMKQVNSDGGLLGELPGRTALSPERFRALAQDGDHVVVDTRDQLAFGAAHVPGAFAIGLSDLQKWAAWVVPYERPILLVLGRGEDAEAVSRALVRVGLDDVVGYLDGGMDAWQEAGFEAEALEQLTPEELHAKLVGGERIRVVDVRAPAEWEAGHIDGAILISAQDLPADLDPAAGQLAVICRSGYRSTVGASVLERNGFTVANVTGGMLAWQRAGLEIAAWNTG